jgi:CBS-domain-containing membrane protein
MQTVADIMTRNVISIQDSDNLHHARMLLKERNIRHLPVVDTQGAFAGLLTQRDMLNNAFNVVEKYGFSKLTAREERTHVKEVMTHDCPSVPSATSLRNAGQHFVVHKHSCLPVVDDGKLVGILTSVDFVKLALHLLDQG